MKEYVCGFVRSEAGAVLLMTKARPAWQAGRINGVGGKIEWNERPYAAMAREFFEEARIATVEADWRCGVIMTGSRNDWRVYFFQNLNLVPSDQMLDYENLTTDEPTRWYAVENLWRLPVLPNLRWLIPLCADIDLRFPIQITDETMPPD